MTDGIIGLTMSEMSIRYLTGETNYNNILPCSLLSFFTCIISLIGKGLLFKRVIQRMYYLKVIPKSPEDTSSGIGEFSHYVWVCLG